MSKQIVKSDRERREFQAALVDKSLTFQNAISEIPNETMSRIREMEEMAARKHGFI